MADKDELKRDDLSIVTNNKPTAGGYKRWLFNDFNFHSIVFSNMSVTLIQSDSGSADIEFSAVTTANSWRADVFITVTLVDAGGANFAQFSLPVAHAFCGQTNQFAKVGGIDASQFNRTQSVSLTFSAPNWARC